MVITIYILAWAKQNVTVERTAQHLTPSHMPWFGSQDRKGWYAWGLGTAKSNRIRSFLHLATRVHRNYSRSDLISFYWRYKRSFT